MILGRLAIVIPSLALAGSLAHKNSSPAKSYRVLKDSPTFAIFLVANILLYTLLVYLPALCLGPILEHFLMMSGVAF